MSAAKPTIAWDLTALLNAADARAGQAERHMWLVRLMEWLRHAPTRREVAGTAERTTPMPLLRLRHLLRVLDQSPEHKAAVQGMLQSFWREIDAVALLADFGFSHRMALRSELWQRVRAELLPGSPATGDLASLFPLLFVGGDAAWIEQLDDALLARVAALAMPAHDPADAGALPAGHWRQTLLDATTILVSAVQAAGFSPPLRQRMSRALLVSEPFRQLPLAAERVREAVLAGEREAALQAARYLRALLDTCRRATDSIVDHLEEYGVSVDIVFEIDQLHERCRRVEQLLGCVLAEAPARDVRHLVATLVQVAGRRRGVRNLMARHYSQLARQVAERSAETGEHYITRSREQYRNMLHRAAGGGLVIAGTTYVKFGVAALGLSAFWGGFWAGVNYAASFVLIMLLHWTVATKQPAMTAPAMASKLSEVRDAARTRGEADDAAAVEAFVDQVAQLIRSQAAGIIGNLALCAPLVLGVQLAWRAAFGEPLVGPREAEYVLHSLTLLGPTALYAAFTGVLLFASSLIAGWTENWFVFHRLDGAIAWNPRIVARLGAARAQRWAAWWRANISGLAANVSLGFMLGVLPVVFAFFGLPIEVRHVTLSTGQLAAAVGAEGFGILRSAPFWWCVAGIAVTGVLNLTVSFWLAFKVAMRSRGIRVRERKHIYAAIRRRLLSQPLSFFLPPR
ncbi:site-specific recombinase [Aquincola sp. MAHUQ-54]|uniref:Site-specific recombinase n=1 Tax=Aquincola agrisoli TaxID=3119538 RepID=A0AAW9QBQ2_9BURK